MIRRALLWCGVLSSVLYLVAIDVMAALARPEAHGFASQMVSELFAIGSATRAILVAPMAPSIRAGLRVRGGGVDVYEGALCRSASRRSPSQATGG